MTLQQMEYIVAVDKYRHFARAAESCGVTQSTLSSLVQKLEIELDITIFDRSSHPVKPTAVGEEIISRAKQLLFNAAQVKELVATRKGESVGKVSLGITSTVAPYLLPKMLKYLFVNHPDIELHVEEARVAALVSQLERGEIDIALLATPLNNSELLEIPVIKNVLWRTCLRMNLFIMLMIYRPAVFRWKAYGYFARAIAPMAVFSLSVITRQGDEPSMRQAVWIL